MKIERNTAANYDESDENECVAIDEKSTNGVFGGLVNSDVPDLRCCSN